MLRTSLSGDGRRLTRRQLLRGATGLALGASAAGLLAACAPQSPGPAAPSGQQQAPASVSTAVVPKDISGAATAAPAAPAAAAQPTSAPAAAAPAAAPTAA